jgi:BolA protein
MNSEERVKVIRERLQSTFSPTHLEIIDDSDRHRGHKGAENGAGHYTVVISAPGFQNKNRITVHREIYTALNDLIPNEIHALKINSLS